MRYLVSPGRPGPLADDVTWTVPAEWLFLPLACDNPACACDQVFRGIASGHATTTALVADVHTDEDAMVSLTRRAVARDTGLTLEQVPVSEALEAVRLMSGAAYLRTLGDLVRVADVDMEDEEV
ncbi:hypothetical protein [Actinomadura sp. 9N215]|uniref:DUF7715 family protein n=1 Tax=Actinomadura sp. 9N215 TaxID=3375150 RepID=UPI0037B3D7B3